MTPTIETRVESARGCGFRKGGGIYLVCDGEAIGCGRLPLRLDVCPTCHAGIKQSRGWTWIDVGAFAKAAPECQGAQYCGSCPLGGAMPDRAGLLWVGEKFYPTPADFLKESNAMGISRRISAVPKDFKVGETWVFFAHRKGIKEVCGECSGKYSNLDESTMEMETCEWCEEGYQFVPAVFSSFRPTRIEYVVKGDETDEELESLAKRGFTLVRVIPNKTPLLEQTAEAAGVH